MKVLFLSSLFPNHKNKTNGVFNLSRVSALRRRGCNVKIIAPVGLTPPQRFFFPKLNLKLAQSYRKNQNEIFDLEYVDNFQVFHPKWYWAPRNIFWKYEVNLLHKFAGKTINKIIEDFKPDLVISSGLHPYGTYAYFVKKKDDVVFLAIAEGGDVLIYPDSYPAWQKIEQIINEYCDLVICVSQGMKKDIQSKRNLKKLKVIKNGFDQNLFYYSPSQVKKQKGKICIISVGYFEYVKGHDILLNAMKLLDEKYHLTLIGDGVFSERYKKFVFNNSLKNRVQFLGQIAHNQLLSYMQKVDIFCLPSRSESFGIALLEAMGCGLPVVATDVGGISEKIINGFNGFLSQRESPGDLADKIKKGAKTEWKHEEIANWVKKNYSWDEWANEIILSYNEIKSRK